MTVEHPRADVTNLRLTLFRGASVDEPTPGMFSFTPVRLAEDRHPRFARPTIRLPGFINPANKQSPSGGRRPRTVEETRAAWESVREQVTDPGCLLGVSFGTPPERPTST